MDETRRDTAPAALAGPGEPLRVLVHRLESDAPLPVYALPGDAGADICAAADVTLAPGERTLLPTGLAIALPEGYAAFVHPRSGLATRAGLGMVNAPGTIDAGYRGELKLVLINHDPARALDIRRGERVAQLVFQRVERAEFVEVARLPESARGPGGHGSTGGAGTLDGAATPATRVAAAVGGSIPGSIPASASAPAPSATTAEGL